MEGNTQHNPSFIQIIFMNFKLYIYLKQKSSFKKKCLTWKKITDFYGTFLVCLPRTFLICQLCGIFFFFLREIVIPLHGIAFLAVHRMMKRKNIDSVWQLEHFSKSLSTPCVDFRERNFELWDNQKLRRINIYRYRYRYIFNLLKLLQRRDHAM